MSEKSHPVSFRLDPIARGQLARLQARYAGADGQPLPAVRVLRMALASLEQHGPPVVLRPKKKPKKSPV